MLLKKMVYSFFPVLLLAGIISVKQKQTEPSPAQVDGPYVLYRGDTVYVNYILQQDSLKLVKKDSFLTKENIELNIMTDEPGKTFQVKLRSKIDKAEETEFDQPEKMFILSDIEGNFRAFRRLLQSNNVIDSNFKWSFGKGHLVLTGDFVDRGTQQTEVLWLIYSLEEQAKAAGGYVHYILGNHEIMNMNGDLRYLNKKYSQHAELLNQGYTSLVGEQSELGRWLRTKNVVERIGDILFCHGGISQAVNRMDLGTAKINKLVRPFYADSLMQYDKPETDTLYSDLGPFWYRGYYYGAVRATPTQVDSTLKAYKVSHIATGHTVIADTISILQGGRIINTDVHHAGGHTEALYVEGNKFYRATSVGEHFLVWPN
jgi:hypothetical protein